MDKSTFITILKSHRAKLTPPRLWLYERLSVLQQAANAYEILESDPQHVIDITTIYRNLELFEQLGIVHHIHHPEGYILCEHQHRDCQAHDLVICENCHRISETHIDSSVKQLLGLTNAVVEVYGVCEQC